MAESIPPNLWHKTVLSQETNRTNVDRSYPAPMTTTTGPGDSWCGSMGGYTTSDSSLYSSNFDDGAKTASQSDKMTRGKPFLGFRMEYTMEAVSACDNILSGGDNFKCCGPF
jgi:hypothetical protein